MKKYKFKRLINQSFFNYFVIIFFKRGCLLKEKGVEYNNINTIFIKFSKLRETIGRKAKGPSKWQPVALIHLF